MKQLLWTSLFISMLIPSFAHAQQDPMPAKWTVFVYMSADNELEPYAFKDLWEMSQAASMEGINVLILLDRQGVDVSLDYPLWNGALEFKLGDDLTDRKGVRTNMGSGKTLSDFLSRGLKQYPAERYAVVLWCHGNGWRDFTATQNEAAAGQAVKPPVIRVPAGIETHLFKAASGDHGDQLYNREIAEALARSFDNRKVDLLAMDSCLMGMLEAAYAFRKVANTYVASEEIVQGYGFDYQGWLTALAANPGMEGDTAGRALVDSYRKYYEEYENQTVTLSAIDLNKIDAVADATSAFASALITVVDQERTAIEAARRSVTAFDPQICEKGTDNRLQCRGGMFHHVDLSKFAQVAAAQVESETVRSSAAKLQMAIGEAVVRNWAAPGRSGGTYGSNGLAVYFPPDTATFINDPWNDHGYDKPATNRFAPYPVEFVADHKWSDFLHAYYFPVEVKP